jgi:hypothetical protein
MRNYKNLSHRFHSEFNWQLSDGSLVISLELARQSFTTAIKSMLTIYCLESKEARSQYPILSPTWKEEIIQLHWIPFRLSKAFQISLSL